MKYKMKKILSLILCLSMMFSYAPPAAVHAQTDSLTADTHTEHNAECGYIEAVEGQPCTHEHSEDCYKVINCLHTCGEECAGGCEHSCSVENGCITMEKDCHHIHNAECGYSEGREESHCQHTHDENCGYVETVEAAPLRAWM